MWKKRLKAERSKLNAGCRISGILYFSALRLKHNTKYNKKQRGSLLMKIASLLFKPMLRPSAQQVKYDCPPFREQALSLKRSALSILPFRSIQLLHLGAASESQPAA
jgi:hypothetical protein